MDDVARYNRERWAALVRAGAVYARPLRDLTAAGARADLDPDGLLGDVSGQRVLCLAGGGGRQSVAFALLGAAVTVLDLSPEQLRVDVQMAAQAGVPVTTIEGDMRDLSALPPASFDIVWQPYALNFVPDPRIVFGQVARVIRHGGLYHLMTANPFAAGIGTGDWDGEGYRVRHLYREGELVEYRDEAWVYERTAASASIAPPREYIHTFGTLVNGLAAAGFVIERVTESLPATGAHAPGSWAHLQSVMPPWLTWWTRYRPDVQPSVQR